MKTRFLAVGIAFLGLALAQQFSKPLTIADLAGNWQSATCEAVPDGQGGLFYRFRNFEFKGDRWQIKVTMNAEKTCTTKLFGFRITGPLELGAASSLVGGATEATFGYAQTFFTAYAVPFAQAFNGAKCGNAAFELGLEQETTITGCIGQPPVRDYRQEYDLVKLENGKLSFGDRPSDNNMSTPERRPQALSSFAVVRR
jgi:Adenomatosis polyposis coli down-regulated 1